MKAIRSRNSLLILLFVTAVLIAGIVMVATWLWEPPSYRFPVPPETVLSDSLAMEFSKKALAAHLKNSPQMLPIPCHPQGQSASNENLYFAVNANDPNRGYVRWSTPQGIYGVTVENQGDRVVCQIYPEK